MKLMITFTSHLTSHLLVGTLLREDGIKKKICLREVKTAITNFSLRKRPFLGEIKLTIKLANEANILFCYCVLVMCETVVIKNQKFTYKTLQKNSFRSNYQFINEIEKLSARKKPY